MKLRIGKIGLVFLLAVPCAVAVAFAAGARSPVSPEVVDRDQPGWMDPNETAFKLKAGGQIAADWTTITFGGQASHLGQFTATGTFDPATYSFHGTMTGGSGDTLNFTLTIDTQPSGEILAQLTFLGGPGRLFNATGGGFGTLNLDADLMFTLVIDGTFRKCVPDFTRSCI